MERERNEARRIVAALDQRHAEERERERIEREFPGLKPGRDCKVYGHHWSYHYGGSYCRHCGVEA